MPKTPVLRAECQYSRVLIRGSKCVNKYKKCLSSNFFVLKILGPKALGLD